MAGPGVSPVAITQSERASVAALRESAADYFGPGLPKLRRAAK